jgi:hypothetical protein
MPFAQCCVRVKSQRQTASVLGLSQSSGRTSGLEKETFGYFGRIWGEGNPYLAFDGKSQRTVTGLVLLVSFATASPR